jgi:F-type H+-transporting ATPase subunit alpha
MNSEPVSLVQQHSARLEEAAANTQDLLAGFQEDVAQDGNLPFSPEELIQEVRGREEVSPPQQAGVEAIGRLLTETASQFKGRVRFQDVGTVQHIGDGVAVLSGLLQVQIDELVAFPTGIQGLVLNLERDHVDVVLLGPDEGIRGGDLVTTTGERLRVPVGPGLLGRVVNSLGEPLDDGGPVEAVARHFVERDAPDIVERAPVGEPLYTGLKVVDALLPIGRGQRELIVGDRKTGKTSLAVDAILRQRGGDVPCVYVAVGQKKTSTLAVIETLRDSGALAHTIVVLSAPDDPPALRYLAPYAGCTMAEYLMYQMDRDVLIVFDDLSKHADAYRELSLLLRRPPGREAYPGDIFYVHARLLERACKLSDEAGGAALTALPIVQVQRGNISAYIPTNLISITDGQIVLDTDLFNRDIKPAVDVGGSVSRVGGAAQTEAMREVAGDVRLDLAQFEEVQRFARFGTEVDPATQRQIERGRRLQEILTQPVHQPLSLGEEIAVLFAATEGYIDEIPVDDLARFERELLEHLHKDRAGLLAHIEEQGELTDRMRRDLHEVLEAFRTGWLEWRQQE